MNTLLLISLLTITGALNIVCFFIGAKVGQTVARNENIEVPVVNPLKVMQERENKKQAEAEQDRINTIMRNIENYDGTSRGQEDVPGRA